MEFTYRSDDKCHSTRFTYITLPRYYLVCFAAVCLKLRSHSSLPRCYKFSPVVDARWEHAAKRFCHNQMGPYFQAVLYQSFHGAPLTFSYFLLQGKVLCFSKPRQDLRDVYCRRPCQKNYTSSYIWHKSFIQMVKYSFSSRKLFIEVSVAP